MSFSIDIQKFVQKTSRRMKSVIIAQRKSLALAIVRRTPFLTGRAQNNWIPTVLNPAFVSYGPGNFTLGQAEEAIQTTAGLQIDKSFFLVNNLPYIGRLEDGYSGKAPSGMVRVTIAEFQERMRESIGGSE